MRRGLGSVAALVAVAMLCAGSPAGAAARDDTDALQAKLDAGGAIFLPKLPGGQCYATRGLWLSRDDTAITSDGACIVALGLGRAQIDPRAKKPHYANAVFDISHSDVRKPVPARVSISGLRIVVPQAKRMHGVLVEGNAVSLTHLSIGGRPLTGIRVGSGLAGNGAMSSRIGIADNTVSGAQRDNIVVYGPIGLRVERNVVSNATLSGIHVRAADRGQPAIDVHVLGNTARRNRGAGIFVDLDPTNGVPVFARGIDVTGNRLLRNGLGRQRTLRAGLLVAGRGEVALSSNTFAGPGLVRRGPRALKTQVPARAVAPPSTGDDTAWLQSRLDRGGGTIFLPKLPGDACYATRGLWISHDHTTITSDGACVVSLGLGAVRLTSADGDPIAASAVFYINRSGKKRPAPVDIEISNLRIVVPPGQGLDGVGVFGHDVTLSKLDISGAPRDDIIVGGRANGNQYAGNVSIRESHLTGAGRNAISADSVIGLDVERNIVEGVRDAPPGQPASGIDLEPSGRSEPTLDVRIIANTFRDNAGPGILLELEPNEGPAIVATNLEIRGNTIVRNARNPFPPKRAGVVLAGGQDGGAGTLVLRDNIIRNNGGRGILEAHFHMRLDIAGNDVADNDEGNSGSRETPPLQDRPQVAPDASPWPNGSRRRASSPS